MHEDTTVFIVEGAKRETDIIEVIKELNSNCQEALQDLAPDNLSSIYLLFDYDEQHRKLLPQNAEPTEIVKSMLSSFNNETDNGLMYISYPMSEAVRDYQDNFCTSLNGCLCSIDDFKVTNSCQCRAHCTLISAGILMMIGK